MNSNYIPAPGWAIVRVIPPGTTAGGIIVPDIDGQETLQLVAKSRGHFKNGVLVPCDAPIGCTLMMLPEYLEVTNRRLERGLKLIQLHDILAWEQPIEPDALLDAVLEAGRVVS